MTFRARLVVGMRDGAGRDGEILRLRPFAFLEATPAQISILSALSVVPYLLLGLIVGALMDRWRRQRTLVLTSVGRVIAFAVVAVLLATDALDFWSLAAVTLVVGVTLFRLRRTTAPPPDRPAPLPRARQRPPRTKRDRRGNGGARLTVITKR